MIIIYLKWKIRQLYDYCKEHNINYFLTAGTMLGAVRHKGFIPWDDDIDICLIRDEYEKLLAILHKELTNTQYYARERWEYGNNFQKAEHLFRGGVVIEPSGKKLNDVVKNTVMLAMIETSINNIFISIIWTFNSESN